MLHKFLTLLTIATLAIHAVWGCHLCQASELTGHGDQCCSGCVRHNDHLCDSESAGGTYDTLTSQPQDRPPHPCSDGSRCKFVTSNRSVAVDFTSRALSCIIPADVFETAWVAAGRPAHRLLKQSLKSSSELRAHIQVWIL